jgi:hypothetical protein
MKFDIADKVILRFSEERKDSSALFRAADGEFATVVERYSQSHLPNVDFYEVELEIPVSIDSRDMVLISGLLDKELERMEPENAGKTNLKYHTKTTTYDKTGKSRKTKMNQHTKSFHQMFGEAFMEQTASSPAISKTNEAIQHGPNDEFVWDPSDERQIFTKKLEYISIDMYDVATEFPPEVKAYFAKRYPDLERLTELGLTKGFLLENIRPEECIIKYWMGVEYGDYGIDHVDAIVLEINVKFSLEIWDVDKDDNEAGWTELIEISDNRNFMMHHKMKYEINNSFPFEAENIEIHMNKSWDPNNWKYEVRFGA